jgi:hypothetical protein
VRRSDMFALRISQSERRMLKALANRLQRSQSDAVRLLIREAVSALDPADPAETNGAATNPRASLEAGERDAAQQGLRGRSEAELRGERIDGPTGVSAQNEGSDESPVNQP